MNFFIYFTRTLLTYSFNTPDCCPSGSSISSSWFCKCANSYYLVDDKVCANSCPSNFDSPSWSFPGSGNSCDAPSANDAILFELQFTSMQDLTATYISNSANSNEKFLNPSSISYNSPTHNSPLPTVDRGFYFATTSSMTSDQHYTPALYFTLNLWIKPLASGEILNVISGSTQYLRIWADSSGVYKFSGTIYDTSSNSKSISGTSTSSYTSSWHKASIGLEQISCTEATISFFINGSGAGSSTISSSEAKFVGGVSYIWTIGYNNPANSFRGFIYWLQARADTETSSFPEMANKRECIDNQYWDGSACQNCDSSCPTWPWCIRGGSCSICYTLDCISCYGYSVSMCTSCTTGIVPGCCDYIATACTQTWSNTACLSTKVLIGGICLYTCPYGFGNCAAVSTAVITADFTGSFAGSYSTAAVITGTSSSSYNFWNSPESSDPYPAKNRGFYFNSNQFLSGSINLSNTWSIGLWVYAISGTIISHSSGKLIIDSSGINFSLEKWDASSTTSSASQSITPNVWSYISYTVGFANKITTVTPYLNKVAGASTTVTNYVFRLHSGGTLYIGKGSTNFNGFIANFVLWQTTISDFTAYYNINTLSGGSVSILWPCDYTQYYDGSVCQSCLGTCTTGCTRVASCYICDDFLCSQCSSFWSGSCTSCISNASGSPCQCNSGYYQPINQALCSACYTGCAHCTGSSYYLCTACNSGYFSYNTNFCVSNCATGYTENSSTKTCDFTSFTGLNIIFYDQIMLNSISGVTVGSLNTNTYPTYDSNDPYPAYLRGYYFTGTTYLSAQVVTAPNFTISIWIYPTTFGTIVSKTISGNEILCLEILSSGNPKLSLILRDSSTFSITLSANTLNSWNFISFTGKIDTDYKTTINSYLNSQTKDSGSSTNVAYFQDSSSGSLYIGTKSSLSSGFIGFLYDIIIYSLNTLQLSDYSTSSCSLSCSACPIDHNCPDSCPLSQYNNGSSCINCKSTCTKGCRSTDTCRLCKTKECNSCTSFSGSCTSCIANAESDGSNGCKCKNNAFWSADLESCELCDALCAVCKQTTYFECTSCTSGKQLVGVLCLNSCPFGYGSSCSQVSTVVIDLCFYTDFQGGYGTFTTGADSSKYQPFVSPETVDPIPTYLRGLYFDSNMYLLSSQSIYISHSFSIGVWIYVITDGDFLQKQTKLKLWSTGIIGVLMDDTAQASSHETFSPTSSFTDWTYLSITIYYTSNASVLSAYINGVSAGSYTVAGKIYRDDASTNLQLGKSDTSGFVGFIFYFQLWNVAITDFTTIINGFTFCSSGNKAICLWSCDMATYKSGSSYAACNSCAKGCRRAVSCNICDDPLCAACTGFESGKCTTCVSNASKNPTNCACNSGFGVSNDGFSCVQCSTGCQTCTGSGYYQCTSCQTGYYFLNIQCLSECPWGYTQNSGTNSCDLSSTTYSIIFSNVILLDTISGVNIGASNTNSYPNYDTNDPYPSYLRGYYYLSSSYLSTSFMFSPSFSISLWIRPLATGFVISKFISTTTMLQVKILSSYPQISLYLSDSSTTISVAGTSSVLVGGWFYISFDCKINSDGTITITSYIDETSPATSTTSAPLYLQDSHSGNLYIGHYSAGFNGFLWNVKIYSQNNNALNDFKTSGCLSSCAKCPSDSNCLDSCPISKYNNGSACTDCIVTCDKGCRNSDTCRLCKTKECATCTEFSGGNSCLTCITNAVSDGSGGCTCAANAFWVASSQTCDLCDALCSACLKTTYFECSACLGIYQLVGNVCLAECPYGFGASCSSVSTAVIDQTFNTDFQGSYGIFTTGTSSASFRFFNTPESYDPIPAYNRGLFFDGTMYLLSSDSVLLSHSFSIGSWIYIITQGDWLEKQTQIISLSSTGSIAANMENPSQAVATQTLSASSSLNSWIYLSYTFSYNLDTTNIAVYLNGASIATLAVSNYIIRDLTATKLIIGKSSTSGFVGFINTLQLWNVPISDFSSYVNNFICGAGLGHSCLWSCNLSHYWDGSSYSACNSCSKGCVRAGTCNICDDLLCSVCTGFGSGKCTQCVENASGAPGQCICNTNYVVSSDGFSCVACSNGCSHCTDITYQKCTACKPGFYFFALTGQCLDECPSRYSSDSSNNICSVDIDLVMNLEVDDNISLSSISGFNVGSVNTNSYPDWSDTHDPIPAYKRGYYFYQNNCLSSSIMISPSFTVSLWAKPLAAGILMTKYTSSDILKIIINSSGLPSLSITFSDSSTSTLSASSSILNNWNYLSLSGHVQNDGKTILQFYINGLANNYIVTTSLTYFKDTLSGTLYIGNDETLGSSGMIGFIARFMMWNSYGHELNDYANSLCNGGCSTCPSNLICLNTCAINEYPDSCLTCISGCSQGCVNGLTCRLCRDKECYSCDTFTGECLSCIAHAYKPVDHCMCIPNAVWVSSSQSCELCHSICSSCSTPKFDSCLTCISGYYRIQSLCMPFCPTGYVINGNICDSDPNYTNYLVFNMMPHQIKDIVVDSASKIPVLTGKDNKFYPNYDTTDPIATIYRGYYFTGSSYMQLPPYSSASTQLLTFAPKFIISAWIKPISDTGVIFSKQVNAGLFTNYISFSILSKSPSMTLTLKDSSTITYSSSVSSLEVALSQWNFISGNSDISSTPQQIIGFSTNSDIDISGDKHASWFIDLQNSFLITIGASHLDATTMTSFFNGFLWDLKIYNEIIAVSSLTSSFCSGCSLCPIDNSNTCLDSCFIDSYWDGSSCTACLSGCSNKGCVRTDKNCNLCQDLICEICDDYTNTCITCKINASLVGTSCQCNSMYYWSSSNENCEKCDISCKTCTSASYLDCLTCADGYYSSSGLCKASCSLGYSPSGNKCILVNEKIFDLDLNTLNGVIYDKANSIPVITGSSKQFYPDYEVDDPIPAYLRGFYFNGKTSVLRLPEYSNYTSPKLLIPSTFTISIWLNSETLFGTLLSKHDISDNYSSLFLISLVSSNPSISLTVNSSPLFFMCQKSLSNYEWSHIEFTFETTQNGDNMISCYINGLSDTYEIAGSGIFQDKGDHTVMSIGAQLNSQTVYNYYQGFVYTIQIFNTVKPVNSLSTISCTENCGVCPLNQICIPNCKINEYWSGPGYKVCYHCNIKCPNSCRDWRSTCSLCNNLLCKDCIDYSPFGCITCKETAINPDSCICDINYVLDTSNNSTCVLVGPGGFRGIDGMLYSCPKLCSTCESSIKCTACVENASLKTDLCYCNLGFNGDTNCTSVAFSAKISALSDNSLYLTFSDNLLYTLSVSNFTITIEHREISYKIEQINETCYYISLNIEKAISKGTLATISFINLEETRSVSNGVLNSSEISVSLNSYDPAPYSAAIESVTSQASAGSQAAISGAVALSIVNPNPSSLWSMMNTLQILSYLTLSGIPLSSKMSSFLNNLNSFNLFPNAFSYFIDKNEGNTPYSQAKEFGFDSDLILINQGNDFTLILASLSVFPIIFFFSRCSYRWLGKKFAKTLKGYQFSFYLRFWIQCYLELGAAASIGFVSAEFGNVTQITNLIICLAVYMLLVATPPGYFWFCYKNKNRIQSREKSFSSLFDTFFYEFRNDKGLLATQYYFVFFARRLIYIINLVFLREYPQTEVTINIVLSLITIMHLFFFWPFNDPILQITNLATEILICFIMISTSVYLFDLGQEMVSGVESAIVAIVLIVMAVQTLSSVFIFARTLYQVIHHKLSKAGVIRNSILPNNSQLRKIER